MSDQHGHKGITRAVAERLFEGRSEINGLHKEAFALLLNRGQELQDASPATVLPYWMVPGAQAAHALADPDLSPQANVQRIAAFVTTELQQAAVEHAASNAKNEIYHLGCALHALQDSYSQGHVWRGPEASAGNPHAPIESINVYTPVTPLVTGLATEALLSAGLPSDQLPPELDVARVGTVMGTHDTAFDAHHLDEHGHPVLNNSDLAAVEGGVELLNNYLTLRESADHGAIGAFDRIVEPYFRTVPDVQVNKSITPDWLVDHDQRLSGPGTQEVNMTPPRADQSADGPLLISTNQPEPNSPVVSSDFHDPSQVPASFTPPQVASHEPDAQAAPAAYSPMVSLAPTDPSTPPACFVDPPTNPNVSSESSASVSLSTTDSPQTSASSGMDTRTQGQPSESAESMVHTPAPTAPATSAEPGIAGSGLNP